MAVYKEENLMELMRPLRAFIIFQDMRDLYVAIKRVKEIKFNTSINED